MHHRRRPHSYTYTYTYDSVSFYMHFCHERAAGNYIITQPHYTHTQTFNICGYISQTQTLYHRMHRAFTYVLYINIQLLIPLNPLKYQ